MEAYTFTMHLDSIFSLHGMLSLPPSTDETECEEKMNSSVVGILASEPVLRENIILW